MRFLFHKTEVGISIVLAGDVLQLGSRFHPLSSSPQRRSLSLCQGDLAGHTLPPPPPHPPSYQIRLRWRWQPSPAGPGCGHGPHHQCSPAPKVPPCCHHTGCPRPGGPRRVWGHSAKAMPRLEPLPVLTPGCPSCLCCPLQCSCLIFHNPLTNEGLTPPKSNCGSLGAGGSPGSSGTMLPSRPRSPARSGQLPAFRKRCRNLHLGSGAPSPDPLSIPQPGPTHCI